MGMDQGHRKAKAVKGVPVRYSIGLALPCLIEKQPEAAGIIRVFKTQTKQQNVGTGSTEDDRC